MTPVKKTHIIEKDNKNCRPQNISCNAIAFTAFVDEFFGHVDREIRLGLYCQHHLISQEVESYFFRFP